MHAVIFANGIEFDADRARQYITPETQIICADGGSRHAHAMGLTPDAIVGDLDSLSPSLREHFEAAGVQFKSYSSHKDQTDLELALHYALDSGATEIDLLAMTGGRLDQSLANVLLLTRAEWRAARLRIVTPREVTWAIHAPCTETVCGTAGDTLSLIPLSPTVTGLSITGVKWPLDNVTVELGTTLTISNELCAEAAQITIESGTLLVIHQEV